MSDYTYQIHEVESGTHILVFKNGVFERKVHVPSDEYRPECLVRIVDQTFNVIFCGTELFVLNWLRRNRGDARVKMVAIGVDMQILSAAEYESLCYG